MIIKKIPNFVKAKPNKNKIDAANLLFAQISFPAL